MTPKEKAKELFDKYCYAIRTEERDSGYFTNIIYAKQCALIAVEEIINEIDNNFLQRYDATDRYFYWKEVKEEIEKL